MTLTIFFTLFVSIFILEFLFSRIKVNGKLHKQYHFSYGRYAFYLIYVIISGIFLVYREGTPLLKVVLVFALIGPVLEWFLGATYHRIVGQRLWTYHQGSINGYTSYLTIPMWAFAGIVAWLVVTTFI